MKWNLHFGWLALIACRGWAAEPAPAALAFFEARVRPVLATKCYECHSVESGKAKGGLQLDSRAALAHGGNSGPVVVPGSPDESLLLSAVRQLDPDLKMPPKGPKLAAQQVSDLSDWIKMGAPMPATAAGTNRILASAPGAGAHWSFQPVRRPALPARDPANKLGPSVANPIDLFVGVELAKRGLEPNPPADRRTLLRRVYYDLIGLPPSPEAVQAFLKDPSPQAFSRVVDELLASPQYGERWARHWLDVARYADTKGDVKKQQEDVRYPHAWTYRDYVVQAFNEDRPYDQFIREQLAADLLLPDKASDQRTLAALGFLTLGDHFNGQALDVINDRIDVVCRGLLGLTVSCARCHDHKTDPIPQADYYSLHGIFASCYEPRELPCLQTPVWSAGYSSYLDDYVRLRHQADDLQKQVVEMRRDARGREAVEPAKRRAVLRDGQRLREEFAALEMNHTSAPPRAQVLYDLDQPRDAHILIRGEAGHNGPLVPRRFLECLSGAQRPAFKEGSGRLELARTIASPTNPLTARVLVNRVWQHHFGEGLVRTVDDFGTMGATPTHPELLDWLASEFVARGWSVKQLHRQILLSETYQRSSAAGEEAVRRDPANEWLARASVRRLDFEALRDGVLAIAGTLDRTVGGRPVDLGVEPYPVRRTLYGYIDRHNVAEILYQFDFPNPASSTGHRYETIVPQQALFLMNNPIVVEAARAVARRPEFLALSEPEARVAWLYDRIYQRLPTAREIELGRAYVAATPAVDDVPAGDPPSALALAARRLRFQQRLAENPTMARRVRERLATEVSLQREAVGAWEKLAHALLQANEASFVR